MSAFPNAVPDILNYPHNKHRLNSNLLKHVWNIFYIVIHNELTGKGAVADPTEASLGFLLLPTAKCLFVLKGRFDLKCQACYSSSFLPKKFSVCSCVTPAGDKVPLQAI